MLTSKKVAQKAKAKPQPQPQPIQLDEVARLPLILPSRSKSFRLLVKNEMNATGQNSSITPGVSGPTAILSLIKESLGHTVLPSYPLSNFDDQNFQLGETTVLRTPTTDLNRLTATALATSPAVVAFSRTSANALLSSVSEMHMVMLSRVLLLITLTDTPSMLVNALPDVDAVPERRSKKSLPWH